MAVLTLGLQNLRKQVNAAFPDRDTRSDGWIGDTAHQTKTSGHNPDDKAGSKPAWNGDPDSTQEVRAWDCDNNLGAGVDAHDVIAHFRRLAGLATVIRYMIYDRHIYHARDGFNPIPYTGAAHLEHIHFEGAWTQAADNNKTFNYRLEEIPVALTTADKQWIKDEITDATLRAAAAAVNGIKAWTEENPEDIDPATGKPRQGRIGGWIRMQNLRDNERQAELLAAIDAVGTPPPADPR